MKIIFITHKQNNFKSGLNWKTKLEEKFVNPTTYQNYFNNYYGIETNFNNNKALSLANSICINLFSNIFSKNNINISLPTVINVYNRSKLIEKASAMNFCIPDTKDVLINDFPFPGRSIFFSNIKNLEFIDNYSEGLFKNQKSSSGHFLAPFIHEWIHSFHLDYIYKNLGYGGYCEYLKEQYPLKNKKITGVEYLKVHESKTLSKKENEIVNEVLGEYSTLPTNQYLEIFSETFTKIICDSLSGIELLKNPFDIFNSFPKEFKLIFNKILNINN